MLTIVVLNNSMYANHLFSLSHTASSIIPVCLCLCLLCVCTNSVCPHCLSARVSMFYMVCVCLCGRHSCRSMTVWQCRKWKRKTWPNILERRLNWCGWRRPATLRWWDWSFWTTHTGCLYCIFLSSFKLLYVLKSTGTYSSYARLEENSCVHIHNPTVCWIVTVQWIWKMSTQCLNWVI